jgi:hypothetical protein
VKNYGALKNKPLSRNFPTLGRRPHSSTPYTFTVLPLTGLVRSVLVPGGSTIFRNVGQYLSYCTGSHPERYMFTVIAVGTANLIGVTRFLVFVRRLVFRRTQRFGNGTCLRPQVRGLETPTLVGPLERANPNYWTACHLLSH